MSLPSMLTSRVARNAFGYGVAFALAPLTLCALGVAAPAGVSAAAFWVLMTCSVGMLGGLIGVVRAYELENSKRRIQFTFTKRKKDKGSTAPSKETGGKSHHLLLKNPEIASGFSALPYNTVMAFWRHIARRTASLGLFIPATQTDAFKNLIYRRFMLRQKLHYPSEQLSLSTSSTQSALQESSSSTTAAFKKLRETTTTRDEHQKDRLITTSEEKSISFLSSQNQNIIWTLLFFLDHRDVYALGKTSRLMHNTTKNAEKFWQFRCSTLLKITNFSPYKRVNETYYQAFPRLYNTSFLLVKRTDRQFDDPLAYFNSDLKKTNAPSCLAPGSNCFRLLHIAIGKALDETATVRGARYILEIRLPINQTQKILTEKNGKTLYSFITKIYLPDADDNDEKIMHVEFKGGALVKRNLSPNYSAKANPELPAKQKAFSHRPMNQ